MHFKTIQARFVVISSIFLMVIFSVIAVATSAWFKQQTTELIYQQQYTMLTTIAGGFDDKLTTFHDALISNATHFPEYLLKDPEAAQRWLDSRRGLHVIFNNGRFLFTPEGKLYVESPKLAGRRGQDFSYREYYKKTISAGRPYISEPYASSKHNHPAVMMTAPIHDSSGRLIAIMGGAVDLLSKDNLFETITRIKVGKKGNFCLFAPDRTVIAHSDLSRIMKRDLFPGVNHLFDKALNGFEGSGKTVNSDGVASIASFKRLKTTGWIFGVSQPEGEVFQTVISFRKVFFIGMILVLLVSATGIWWLAGSITSGLSELTAGMEQVDPRHLADSSPIVISTGDELERLATAFNRLLAEASSVQHRLAESEARLRSITTSAQDAILMMGSDGNISFWNPAAELILGYKAEEVLGKNLHNLLAPTHHIERHHAAFPGFARTGAGHAVGKTVELSALRKDGKEINVSLSLSAVEEDGAWNAVGILRDISDLKHYQQELIEASHAADAANRAKSEFLANMSHEIRTPMNGIIGMIQLLCHTEPTEKQKEYLDNLDSSSRNLLALINDILDLSKIEAGKVSLEHAAFSLNTTIKELIDIQMLQIKQKGLKVVTSIPEELPDIVIGDPLRFRQILLNLLGNAIKFTDNGEMTIGISVLELSSDAVKIQLAVRDTGIGMEPDTITRIFAPFEQADNSTTRRYGGSGLGLSICRRLTELMGGRIWAESVLGEGSAFFVEFSFGVRTGTLDDAQIQQEEAPIHLPENPLRILVAEDNKINAVTAVAMLSYLGHDAEVAADGSEAVERWNSGLFDCILMDIQMPVMDGRLAAATIRGQESSLGEHTPIIALTAHALQGDRESFVAEGFDGYVAKPVQISDLAAELMRVTADLNKNRE